MNGWRRCSFVVQCNPAHDKLVSIGLVVSCQEAVAETAQTGSDVSVHIGFLLLCEPSACAQAVPSGLLLEGPAQKNSDGGHSTISCCLKWEMPGEPFSACTVQIPHTSHPALYNTPFIPDGTTTVSTTTGNLVTPSSFI